MSNKRKTSSTRIDSVDINSRTIDEKYCDCIIGASTGSPKYNPYAVCKSSIYIKRGIESPGNIDCFPYYKFETYKPDKLKAYANMLGLKTDNLEHKQIVDLLYSVKKYKSKHPELPIRQVSILLSEKSKSRMKNAPYKSNSPVKNTSYKSNSPVKNTSYKSNSPVKNTSYKSNSPVKNTSYKSYSLAKNTSYKSYSPAKNTSYKSYSPVKRTSYKSYSPVKRTSYKNTSYKAYSPAKNISYKSYSPVKNTLDKSYSPVKIL